MAKIICDSCKARQPEGMRFGRIEGRRYCITCWDAASAAYQARKAEECATFWASRGIRPGQEVKFRIGTLFGPALARGVARVGKHGAYISSPRYPRRQIDPAAFVSAA